MLSVNRDRFVLGVDLDGVVADFYAGLRPIAAEWYGVPVEQLTLDVSYGLQEWGLSGGEEEYHDLHRFAVTQRELFRNLRPMPGAPAALRRIAAHDLRVRIITHRLFIPHFHHESVVQTTDWLDRHGIPYWDLCFMKDKAAVGADLYIEDAPHNVMQLRNDGHPTIVFANSTNRDLEPPRTDSWDEIERLVYQQQERWKASEPRKQLAGH